MRTDEVKGYERGEDEYVHARRRGARCRRARKHPHDRHRLFVPADSVDWIWYDTPHYLVAGRSVGEEAFSRHSRRHGSTEMVGDLALVLYRRERAVMLEPRDNGIVLWTLRFGDEVREASEYFGAIGEAKPDAELMRLIGDLIKSRKKAWSPEMVADPVQAQLLDIIAAKKKGAKKAKAKPKAEPEAPSNVINIMDALRRSVASAKKPKGR